MDGRKYEDRIKKCFHSSRHEPDAPPAESLDALLLLFLFDGVHEGIIPIKCGAVRASAACGP